MKFLLFAGIGGVAAYAIWQAVAKPKSAAWLPGAEGPITSPEFWNPFPTGSSKPLSIMEGDK